MSSVFLRAHPRLADALRPERWPEVEAIGAAFAEGIGQAKQYLGAYDRDAGVRRVVELLAVGFPQRGIEYVARVVPADGGSDSPAALERAYAATLRSDSGTSISIGSATSLICRRTRQRRRPPTPSGPRSSMIVPRTERRPKRKDTRAPTRRVFFREVVADMWLILSPRLPADHGSEVLTHGGVKRGGKTRASRMPGVHLSQLERGVLVRDP
jgi:hypothetical protein